MKEKLLISQDLSCLGQVSLSVALPILGACGYQPDVLPTAILSTHTGGFGNNTFLALNNEMSKIIAHWQDEKITFKNLYLGYLGRNAIDFWIEHISDFRNTDLLILLDPAMADSGKLYSGLDIEYVEKNNLTVGDLYCCSMHETPYDTNFFDIGECVGSLEYFEKNFVQQAVAEFSRIMKSNGRFVLDIPNIGSPEFEITKLIEEYLGRQDQFNLSVEEFETILDAYFIIDKREIVGPMIQYFLITK